VSNASRGQAGEFNLLKRYLARYLAGLYLTYTCVLFGVVHLPDRGSIGHDVFRLVAPLLELGLAFFVIAWLMRTRPEASLWRRRPAFVAGLLVACIVGMVYGAQVVSLHMSDNFITVLALENGGEGRLARGPSLYVIMGVAIAWWLLFAGKAVALRARVSDDPAISRTALAVFVISLALVVWLSRYQAGDGRLEVGYRQTPMASLIYNLIEVQKSSRLVASGRAPGSVLELSKLAVDDYPFERRTIYRSPLPFPPRGAYSGPPNVVVIFTEGFSARLIGAYGGTYPGLTPNIDRLASRSMRVDNYFNHTAATYRALQGQLDSGYPEAGGKGENVAWDGNESIGRLVHVRYQTVPRLLREAGYRSYFFSPHPDVIPLNTMIAAIGFDTVFDYEHAVKLSSRYGENPIQGSLNDAALFDEMIDFFRADEKDAGQRPMFVGAYNIGTHAFMERIDGAAPYGDGSNHVLDRVHDFDLALGRFLDYFFASPYARNTILILTADHATYPEPAYRELMDASYKPYFVDRIPLIVYDPTHALPPTFDASGRTSVDFAPTLMQLLGIRKAGNSFLGTTLFEPAEEQFGFAAIGNDFLATDRHTVYAEAELPDIYRAEFERRKAAVQLYYRLERENRIFDSQH
jgi:phosphoglycerol transferase MdoB-like AlkP superfamily enzyme